MLLIYAIDGSINRYFKHRMWQPLYILIRVCVCLSRFEQSYPEFRNRKLLPVQATPSLMRGAL